MGLHPFVISASWDKDEPIRFWVKRSKVEITAWPNILKIPFPVCIDVFFFLKNFVTSASWDRNELIRCCYQKSKGQGPSMTKGPAAEPYHLVYLENKLSSCCCLPLCVCTSLSKSLSRYFFVTFLYYLYSWCSHVWCYLFRAVWIKQNLCCAVGVLGQRIETRPKCPFNIKTDRKISAVKCL